MQYLDLELKNYRCFEDINPCRVRIGVGFTALLGTNNSGKSSLLKFFWEFRELWKLLPQDTGNLIGYGRAQPRGFTPTDTYDSTEVFCDTNDRDLSVVMSFPPNEADKAIGDSYISCLRIVIFRRTRSSTLEFAFSIEASETRSTYSGTSSTSPSRELNFDRVTNPGHHVIQTPDIAKIGCHTLFSLLHSLSNVLYIPPFRNTVAEGEGTYYGMHIGSSFVNVWEQWREGASKAHKSRIRQVTEDIRDLFGFKSLDISASPALKTLNVTIDGRPYTLRELGSGITQFILVLGNAAITSPSFMLIDEPELHLHPEKQVRFITAISRYAPAGTVFATHSIGLARATAERIYFLTKTKNSTEVRILEKIVNVAELLGELSYSSMHELGCTKLLLVEGATEVKTIQQMLRKLGKDADCLLVPLGGTQMIRANVEAELRELTRLTVPIFALIDSERTVENEPLNHNRAGFAQSCDALGITLHILQRRATENYFPESAVKAALGQHFNALQPYESLGERRQGGWAKADNWRIAQHCHEDDVTDSDLWTFLKTL